MHESAAAVRFTLDFQGEAASYPAGCRPSVRPSPCAVPRSQSRATGMCGSGSIPIGWWSRVALVPNLAYYAGPRTKL